MSQRLYEFLTRSELFDDRFLHQNQLEPKPSILEDYVRHCIKVYDDVVNEIQTESRNGIRVFEAPFGNLPEKMPTTQIMAQSIIQDLIILPDPLFSYAWSLQNKEINSAHSQLLGMKSQDESAKLRSICLYMKKMSPFVSGKILKFHPDLTKISAPGIPIKYSPNAFSDAFDKKVLKWLHSKAKTHPVCQDEKGLLIEPNQKLQPCRSIYIEFDDSEGECNNFYNLYEQKILSLDEKTGEAEFALYLPQEPPQADHFRQWVFQSVNQSGSYFVKKVQKDIFFAKHLKAKFAPQNPFIQDLINQTFSFNSVDSPLEKSSVPQVSFLLNVPITDEIEEILKIRADMDALVTFRSHLQTQFKDLSSTNDQSELSRRSKAIMDELNRKHLPEVEKALKNRTTKETLRWSAIAAGMGVSYLTLGGQVTVLAGLGAIAEGKRATRESMEKIKANPGYFWSKIKKNN